MKRLTAVITLMMLFLLVESVSAADSLVGEYHEEFSALLEGVPDEIRAEFENALTDEKGLTQVREKFDFGSFFGNIFETLEKNWPSALSLFVKLFGWILVAGVFKQLESGYLTGKMSAAFSFCTILVFSLFLVENVNLLLSEAVNYLSGLTKLSGALAPISVALLTASGRLTFAAVTYAALMLLFSLFQNIGTVLLIPLVRASFALGVVDALSSDVRVDRISKCVRKTFTVLITFLMVAISFVIGIQSVLSKGADTFTMKTVKFALGNMIPLIGGALSDALSTVSGSLGLIRSAAGGICVVALLALVLPIVFRILLYRLAMMLCQSMAEMIGCDREAKLIGEMHALLGCILALVSLSAVLFLFVLALFVLMGGAG